jgi:tetratricopeptide (TPR) repeat protein
MQKWSRVAVLILGLPLCTLAGESARVADLPKVTLTDFPSEVRTQVQQAYEAAHQHPRDAEASGRLGMLLDLYHRPDEASICYQAAHELDPKSFKWLYYLGSLQAKQGKHLEAAQTLRAVLRLRPDYLPARLKLGDSLFAAGELDQSNETYSAIIKQWPEAAEAYYGLGRISAARGNQTEARELFRKACDLFPPYGAAHYALAQVDRKLGRSEESDQQLSLHAKTRTLVPPVEDPLRDALRALDVAAESHLERGVELEQAGRLEDAIAETEKALRLDPTLVLAHANLIILYGRTGNLEKAEEHYRAAVMLNPNQFPDAYYNYGMVLMKEGKLDEAEGAFSKALEINPSFADAHNNLGFLLERQGKFAEAIAEYKKAVEHQPDFRQAHFNLGRVLVNQRQYEEGIQQLEQTLKPVDDATPAYLYALGAAYGRAGERQKALRYLQEAREQASARGQAQLLIDIEKDLQALGAEGGPR